MEIIYLLILFTEALIYFEFKVRLVKNWFSLVEIKNNIINLYYTENYYMDYGNLNPISNYNYIWSFILYLLYSLPFLNKKKT